MMSAMLRLLTAGESHGKGLVAVLEGLPADVPVSSSAIARELARRRHGYGRGGRQRFEADAFDLLAGVRHGRSLGAPIAVTIPNVEFDAKFRELMAADGEPDPSKRLTRPRPGHADLVGHAEVRVRRCAQRPRAGERAGDRRSRGGRCPLQGVPR